MSNRTICRIRVGRRAARRMGLGNGAQRGRCIDRRLFITYRPTIMCQCKQGHPCTSPYCHWYLPFCLAALCWAASAVLFSRFWLAVACLLVLISGVAACLLCHSAGLDAACFFPCMSLGSRVGPVFGRAFCAFRVFGSPVSAKLIGRKGTVKLYPSKFGSGLGYSKDCTFPVFMVLPSNILVPACSLLIGSSFISPVCAGRLVRPATALLEIFFLSLRAKPAHSGETRLRSSGSGIILFSQKVGELSRKHSTFT